MISKKWVFAGIVLIIALILFILPASAAIQSNLNSGPGYEYAMGDVAAGSSQIYIIDVTSSDTYNILALVSGEANLVDISVSDATTGASITPVLIYPYVENGLKYTWLVSTRAPGKYSVTVHSSSGSGRYAFIHFYNSGAVYRPTTTIYSQQDPIVGIWRCYGSSSGIDIRYQFKADGTFVYSLYVPSYDRNTNVIYGTWHVQGINSYALTSSGGTRTTVLYDPVQKSWYETVYPALVYTSYQGNVAAASTSLSTTVTTIPPTTVKTTTTTTKPATAVTISSNVVTGSGWDVPYSPSDLSGASSGNPIAWKWDFGDGSTSTQKSGTHSYSSAGYWTVKLTVTYQGGSTQTFSTTWHTYYG